MLHRVAPTLTRNSAQRLCRWRRFDCTINVCSEQSAYGNGAGVAAARGHLDVPVIVALEPSVVSDAGLRFSSGVGVGVASDFGLAPWSGSLVSAVSGSLVSARATAAAAPAAGSLVSALSGSL